MKQISAWKSIGPRKHIDEERFEARAVVGDDKVERRLVVSGKGEMWFAAVYEPRVHNAMWMADERFKTSDEAKAACEKWVEEQKKPPMLEGQDPKSEIDPRSLQKMRDSGGRWAAYRNQDLSSLEIGHLKFMKFGLGCTFEEPPKPKLPDTAREINWRYCFAGIVDTTTGLIAKEEEGCFNGNHPTVDGRCTIDGGLRK